MTERAHSSTHEDLATATARAAVDFAVGDHLTTYFRELAEHTLLTAEEEREIATGIEDTEVLTWQQVLVRPEVVRPLMEHATIRLGLPTGFPKLEKFARECQNAKAGPTRQKLQVKYTKEARTSALALRALDLDRVIIDGFVKSLEASRAAADRGAEVFWCGTGHYSIRIHGAYIEEVLAINRQAKALRDRFVEANLRLVVTMAKRYDRGGMPLADLIQEGNLGLMHAIGRYDPRRGLRFSTYACWWIRHAITRAIADKSRAVRIPVHMLEAQQQIERQRQVLTAELGRAPTPQELATATKLPLEKVEQMHLFVMGTATSLDRPLHEGDDRAHVDVLVDPESEDASPEDVMTQRALKEQVAKLLHFLSPVEADVLRQRFGLEDDEERTFREIGDQYNLSRERIRQIQNAALEKLKKLIVREHRGTADF